MAGTVSYLGKQTSTANTCTLTGVTLTSSDSALIVSQGASKGGGVGTLTSIKWDPAGANQTLTLSQDATYASGDARNTIGHYQAPTAGTSKNITSTMTGAPDEHSFVAMAAQGTVTSGTYTYTPPAASTGTGTTSNKSHTGITSGDVVFDCIAGVDSGGGSPTVTHSQTVGGGNTFAYIAQGGSGIVATSTSQTMTQTFSVSMDTYRHIVLGLIQSAGGGGVTDQVPSATLRLTGAAPKRIKRIYEKIPAHGT